MRLVLIKHFNLDGLCVDLAVRRAQVRCMNLSWSNSLLLRTHGTAAQAANERAPYSAPETFARLFVIRKVDDATSSARVVKHSVNCFVTLFECVVREITWCCTDMNNIDSGSGFGVGRLFIDSFLTSVSDHTFRSAVGTRHSIIRNRKTFPSKRNRYGIRIPFNSRIVCIYRRVDCVCLGGQRTHSTTLLLLLLVGCENKWVNLLCARFARISGRSQPVSQPASAERMKTTNAQPKQLYVCAKCTPNRFEWRRKNWKIFH